MCQFPVVNAGILPKKEIEIWPHCQKTLQLPWFDQILLQIFSLLIKASNIEYYGSIFRKKNLLIFIIIIFWLTSAKLMLNLQDFYCITILGVPLLMISLYFYIKRKFPFAYKTVNQTVDSDKESESLKINTLLRAGGMLI